MTPKNAFYAQSGGVTAVINASACGVLQTAREHPREIGNVYAGRNGIIGALTEDLIDTSVESDAAIAALKHTPGAAFGSCRYKLKSIHEHREQYERLIEVFRAHDVGFFFYNGGGDSQDTAYKVSQMCTELSYAMVCIGIPKTVDNDLPITDCSPGFGSAAKYVATSLREAAFDLSSMCRTSTKVFVLEVMGRHAGWTTAACALAAEHEGGAPHVLLLPEVVFNEERFLAKVRASVERYGHCVLAVSEGVKGPDGAFLSASRSKDAFGHTQLGGVAPIIADLITGKLGFKCHWAVADYLQRSARHKLPRRMSSKPTQWVVRRSNSPLTEGVRSCRPSAGLTTRPIAGRSSRCRSVKLPTRKNCSLQTSSVPMASASPKRPVVI
jgi:ATP-dependent phosphofructokinase / diphosphate-dependent phosphofructokinase